MDIRKKNFTERVAMHWNRLLRKVAKSQSLDAFRRCVDVELKDMVYG